MIQLKSVLWLVLWLSCSVVSAQPWQAKWITAADSKDTANSWFGFRKDFSLKAAPHQAIAKIAADSKYWLWINGEPAVFEGGLKRGPNPNDTYYDELDIAPYLKKGKNTITVKLWFFGKHGFSHNSSGQAGLIFDCAADGFSLQSDSSWHAFALREYQTAPPPFPNYRLPESSILYDARLADTKWILPNSNADDRPKAVEIGEAGSPPWNNLVLRPIPFWKDYGLKDYEEADKPYERKGDTVVCKLPYNAQFTPYLKVKAKAGERIVLVTDNYVHYNGSDDNLRAEYITRDGVQEYESLGWLNGHRMYYIIPHNVELLELKYRETGYDTEFAGSFSSDNAFFNTLWNKALRTLYITMRDTYMDCPDRERAQWTGDAVLEAEEAFYALNPSSHALTRKWLYELIGWQREDGSMFAPVPAGNWNRELPCQVLASIGYYGIWTYYMHTADVQVIRDLYPAIQRYLALWERESDGLVKMRTGDWTWGDWGDNRDMLLIYNLWYYLALKGSHLMAIELGEDNDASTYMEQMLMFENAFNERFWNGAAYRDPAYHGQTDDRAQALAVVAGVADPEKYPMIMQVFATEEHASPYMEKYVFEAMYQMGYPKEANTRHEKRFSKMVNHDYFTTLFEGWGIGGEGFGGGTVNHAWSGGGLTVLSSRLCGIRPIEPGYKLFTVAPQPGDIAHASATLASVIGDISAAFQKTDSNFTLEVKVPESSTAIVQLPPNDYQTVSVNGEKLFVNGRMDTKRGEKYEFSEDRWQLRLPQGKWTINASL